MTYLKLIFRNVGRNPLRSLLTAHGDYGAGVRGHGGLVDSVDVEPFDDRKEPELSAMVTERWSIPSRMPYAYATSLSRGGARHPSDARPTDWMSWQFYGGTIDPGKLTRESIMFCIACEPDKLATMLEGMDNLPASDAAQLHRDIVKLKAKRQGIIVGHNHLDQHEQARRRTTEAHGHCVVQRHRFGVRDRGRLSR